MLKTLTACLALFNFSLLFSSSVEFPKMIDFGKMGIFQDSIRFDEEDSWTRKLADSAFELGYIAFNDSPEIGTFVNFLKHTYAIDTAVETGTFLGDTTLFFSLNFDHVHTIEGSEVVYRRAKERLKYCTNVQCHLGSSEKVFRDILPSLQDKRILFYLDAHAYHLDAERQGFHYWPILDELEEISKTHKDNCIVVIDDFKVPGTDIHGCLDLNGENELSHGYIQSRLRKIFTGYTFRYLVPKNASRAAKFVAIPQKWQNNLRSERIDVLPGLDLSEFFFTFSKVKEIGLQVQVVNQFFGGHDQSNYAEDTAYDNELKKIIVFNNTVDPSYLSKFPKEKLILFLFEPLLLPHSYYDPCSRVYTWNDDLVDGIKFFKLYYPYLIPMHTDYLIDKKLCVMISWI